MKHYTYEEFYQLPSHIRDGLVSTQELANLLGVTSSYISEIARKGIIKPYCTVSLYKKDKHPRRYFDKDKVLAFFKDYEAISGYRDKQKFASIYWGDN